MFDEWKTKKHRLSDFKESLSFKMPKFRRKKYAKIKKSDNVILKNKKTRLSDFKQTLRK
jgi:hypothetical protein